MLVLPLVLIAGMLEDIEAGLAHGMNDDSSMNCHQRPRIVESILFVAKANHMHSMSMFLSL